MEMSSNKMAKQVKIPATKSDNPSFKLQDL